MNKLAAPTALAALLVGSFVHADGPPAGGTLELGAPTFGKAVSYTGGVMSTPASLSNGTLGKSAMSPLVITLSTGAGHEIYDWISQSVVSASTSTQHDLSLNAIGADGKSVGGIKVQRAFINEIDFPAVSRADTSAASLVVTFGGLASSALLPQPRHPQNTPRGWQRSAFTAEIGGVASGASAVTSIKENIPWSTAAGNAVGKPVIAPFHMTFDATSLKPLEAWLAQGKVARATGASAGQTYAAKSVKVVYESSDEVRSPVFVLTLSDCGPMSVTPSGATVDVGVDCASASLALGLGTSAM